MQMTIDLDPHDVARIKRVGSEKGLGFSPTARMLLRERLNEIERVDGSLAEAPAGS